MPIRRARCGRCQAKSADNTGCCKGERRQWRKQRTEAGAAVAECEGLLPPKHDAGTATQHYRAFWQRRCRAAAAGAVLKPSGGNCAVLPLNKSKAAPRFLKDAVPFCVQSSLKILQNINLCEITTKRIEGENRKKGEICWNFTQVYRAKHEEKRDAAFAK